MKSPVRKLSIVSVSLALIMIAQGPSFAQTASNTPKRPKRNPAPSGGVMGGGVTAIASGFGGIRTIAGQPFSAEEQSERSQVLADGTHVVQTSQNHKYRDSQGRTRSELVPAQRQEERLPPIVHIYDPVARVRYMLEMLRRVAHRYEFPALGENRPRVEPSEVDTADQPPQRTRVARPALETTADSADEGVRRKISHISLGTQTFEGIEARGLQTSITIPAGAEGNDRPIEIVCENWESPELKLMMLSKCTDPLRGDHTTRVVSIDRSEPDASLFQVPPDFTIEEQQTRVVPESATGAER